MNTNTNLINEEWKVYLNTRLNKDFDIARAARIGDYVDPNSFLGLFTRESGNNHLGWTSGMYDKLVEEANMAADKKICYDLFQQAGQILIDTSSIAPIYTEASVNLVRPIIKDIYPNLMIYRPLKHVHLPED